MEGGCKYNEVYLLSFDFPYSFSEMSRSTIGQVCKSMFNYILYVHLVMVVSYHSHKESELEQFDKNMLSFIFLNDLVVFVFNDIVCKQ